MWTSCLAFSWHFRDKFETPFPCVNTMSDYHKFLAQTNRRVVLILQKTLDFEFLLETIFKNFGSRFEYQTLKKEFEYKKPVI